jgi:two-component system, OmpR family, sensor kinase
VKQPLQWLNDAAARTPLRIKLVATVLVLASVGLTLAAVAATTSLHSYLVSRVDDQLRDATGRIARGYGFGGGGPGNGANGGNGFGNGFQGGSTATDTSQPPTLPSEFYVVPFSSDGVPDGNPQHELLSKQSPPALPKITTAFITAHDGRPFTVSSRDGKTEWRVVARSIPNTTGGVAIATSLTDLDHTVDHLILIEVLIGAIALIFMGGGGYFLIKRSLRPLVEVEHTAAAIAAGDLSQRVPQGHPRTEVGRLSGALNSMLTQIEDAFAKERTSKRQARASEDRMRQFVADASHELRTPLTSIRGFAELYGMGAATEEADIRRLMRRVEDEASRMGVLVEDLLLLARLDQQRPLELAPVDLLEIASDVVHDAHVVAPARSIDLQVHAASPPVVLGDESRLRQVVHNLMTNAITHTPEGTPITVILSTYDGPDARAVLDVADAGPGLSKEQTSRVFERFYRADTSRSRAAGGTGLGLSIVAGIVASHGGRVSVESADGDGAVFRVELPLATVRLASTTPHSADSPIAASVASGEPDGAEPPAT